MRNRIIAGLSVALLAVLSWGIYGYHWTQEYRLAQENQSLRSINDLAAHLDGMETSLVKSQVASGNGQRILYLSQLAMQSTAAGTDYAQLPAEATSLSYVGQFVNQVGDISSQFAYKLAGGTNLTPEEEALLTEVHNRLLSVNQTVQSLLIRVHTEELAWLKPKMTLGQRLFGGQVALADADDGKEGNATTVRSGLEQLDASLQKLPPLSYEGEYAIHEVSEALGLRSEAVISSEQAAVKARTLLNQLGIDSANLEYAGESQGDIPCFIFRQDTVYLEMTKRGGKVRFFQDTRQRDVRTWSVSNATMKAISTLTALGWPSMAVTATTDNGSSIRVECVNESQGIRYYPDKVVVEVGLDRGQIVGLNATPYWAYHHERNVEEIKLFVAEARARLRSDFKISESRLTLIAKPGNQEALCYEFRGRYGVEEYLIYLNATDGREEMIKRVILTPRGEFLQ
ncbi:MAG: germination protein YpeB [Peptococcaceae bacterium]|jgi:spore germination protein|nr:germination protein YpeB [Peptococcaceae bacterium]